MTTTTYADFASALDGLLSRQAFSELCPPDALRCDTYPLVTVGEESMHALCPAWEDDTCPHWPERRARWLAEDLTEIGFPREFLAPTWDRVPVDRRETLRLYCDTLPARVRAGEGVIFSGQPGCGKTAWLALVAAAATTTVCMRGQTPPEPGQRPRPNLSEVSYVRASALFDDLHHGVEVHFRAVADLLLIDDLGTEWPSQGSSVRFNALIDERWARHYSTVITTNLTKAQMEAEPGMTRLISRLSQRNPWLWTDGEDQRGLAPVETWGKAPDPGAPQRLVVPEVSE